MAVTQQKIQAATKHLVVTAPFNQITVTSIMRQAQLRRQTFYDWYRDKYDVLGDIYQSEVAKAAAYCGDYRYWQETVSHIAAYFDDNRAFYQRVLAIDAQNAPDTVIQRHLEVMVAAIVHSMAEAESVVVQEDDVTFLAEVQGAALMAAVRHWLAAPQPASVATETRRLQTYIEDSLNGYLLRARRLQVVNGHA